MPLTRNYPVSYLVGVDLGQRADYTAVCVLEEPVYIRNDHNAWQWLTGGTGWQSPETMLPENILHALHDSCKHGRPGKPPLSLRHIERLPLGTAYDKVVAHVKQLIETPPLAGRYVGLVVDETGVGNAVTDMFRAEGLEPVPVTITGGSTVNWQPPGYRVPKRDLVTAVQVLLQTGRLKISRRLPHAELLINELRNFRVTINPATAHDSYAAWREEDHDDLVLATALAAWHREFQAEHWDHAAATAPERNRIREEREREKEEKQARKRMNRSPIARYIRR
jgi:hypothetical protein